jgi:hypothetical protein
MKSKLIIGKDGTKKWKLPNGYLHREGEPAIEYTNGTRIWYLAGHIHREDGLAIVWHDGAESWYLNDVEYTEQEYKYEMRSVKLKQLL